MSELIPSYSVTKFKSLTAHEIRQLKCCEITSDGKYLFTFINPNTDYIKCQAENMGQLSNSVGGKDLKDIVGEPVEV